ncbi:hypothetical protein AB0F91_05935 [Amycolatopsis sp. NPDC023774]|uniref:hypothetical protein n=1 Tax=Amycolatopsis sp. NPDC023774 TaxID=3155015 RepID=UPI003404E9BA
MQDLDERQRHRGLRVSQLRQHLLQETGHTGAVTAAEQQCGRSGHRETAGPVGWHGLGSVAVAWCVRQHPAAPVAEPLADSLIGRQQIGTLDVCADLVGPAEALAEQRGEKPAILHRERRVVGRAHHYLRVAVADTGEHPLDDQMPVDPLAAFVLTGNQAAAQQQLVLVVLGGQPR